MPGAALTITTNAGIAASGSNGGDGGAATATGSGITGTVNAGGGLGGEGAAGTTPGDGGYGGVGTAMSCVTGMDGADGTAVAGAPSIANSGSAAFASLTFSAPVAPAAIPTLGEWAMILLASLMAMFAIRRMRRQ